MVLCRCLKQHAKLYQGNIDSISKYCPLDLFSGDKTRMKRAIFDLCDNPCNRFKLFKNGKLLYTQDVGNKEVMMNTIKEWFGVQDHGLDLLAALLCTTLLSPIEEQRPFR